ncbi:MAG: cysteine biosynthesis protein CysZ [Hyphomicrobiales bacterium]|nr:MAG: cysteine biosynthesis protein CysZ [Hyphomicrobiales bacterium]
MLHSLEKTLAQLFSPPFRSVLLRSIGLTIGLFIVIGIGVQAALASFAVMPWEWLAAVAAILAGLGTLVGAVFLLAPVTSLFAGLFLDEIAGAVEARHYPHDPAGTELPLAQSLFVAVKFTFVVILVNLGVLIMLILPGINVIAFYLANGYLLGREYFELVAMRHHPIDEARALRRKYRLRVFLSGLVIAGLVSIPLLNLLAPLFATAFMTHQYKRFTAPEAA